MSFSKQLSCPPTHIVRPISKWLHGHLLGNLNVVGYQGGSGGGGNSSVHPCLPVVVAEVHYMNMAYVDRFECTSSDLTNELDKARRFLVKTNDDLKCRLNTYRYVELPHAGDGVEYVEMHLLRNVSMVFDACFLPAVCRRVWFVAEEYDMHVVHVDTFTNTVVYLSDFLKKMIYQKWGAQPAGVNLVFHNGNKYDFREVNIIPMQTQHKQPVFEITSENNNNEQQSEQPTVVIIAE